MKCNIISRVILSFSVCFLLSAQALGVKIYLKEGTNEQILKVHNPQVINPNRGTYYHRVIFLKNVVVTDEAGSNPFGDENLCFITMTQGTFVTFRILTQGKGVTSFATSKSFFLVDVAGADGASLARNMVEFMNRVKTYSLKRAELVVNYEGFRRELLLLGGKQAWIDELLKPSEPRAVSRDSQDDLDLEEELASLNLGGSEPADAQPTASEDEARQVDQTQERSASTVTVDELQEASSDDVGRSFVSLDGTKTDVTSQTKDDFDESGWVKL